MTAALRWVTSPCRNTRVPRLAVLAVALVGVLVLGALLLAARPGPDDVKRYTQAQHDCYVNAPTQVDADACIR